MARRISYQGESLSVSECAARLGISAATLYLRLGKMSEEEAVVPYRFLKGPVVLGGPREEERKITFNGKSQTLFKWAEELNINYGTLRSRLFRHGWSVEKAFGIQSTWTYLEHDGVSLTIPEWSKRSGIGDWSIRHRLENGWSVEQTLTTPVEQPDTYYEYNGERLNIAEWARRYDLLDACLRGRLEGGWPIEEALTTRPVTWTYLEYDGQRLTIPEWAKRCGFSMATIRTRLEEGWSVEDTLTIPPKLKTDPNPALSAAFRRRATSKKQKLAEAMGLPTPTTRTLTKEQAQNLYRDGRSGHWIAYYYDYSDAAIYRWLQEMPDYIEIRDVRSDIRAQITHPEEVKRAARGIRFQGELLTIPEWAAKLGMSQATLYLRLKTMPEEDALSLPLQHRTTLTYRGETLRMKEWAARLGISRRTLEDRLQRMPVPDALSMPAQPIGSQARQIKFRGETLTPLEWATRLNISHGAMNRRLAKMSRCRYGCFRL